MDISNPALKQALQDVEILNTPRQWAKLYVLDWANGTYAIRLDYGAIHSDGTYEIAICSRSYTMRDDRVVVTSQTHC